MGVLADPTRKYHSVNTAHRRDQRSGVAGRMVTVIVDGFSRSDFSACQQFAHVGTYPGNAEQTTSPVQQIFQAFGIQSLIAQQGNQHAGINRSRAGSHHQSISGGISHRRRKAFAVADGAHAGTVAKMCHQQSRRQTFSRLLGQVLYHMRVIQSMETIPLISAIMIGTRQWQSPGCIRLGCMERRIKAGNMRGIWQKPLQFPQHLKPDWHMQWCK